MWPSRKNDHLTNVHMGSQPAQNEHYCLIRLSASVISVKRDIYYYYYYYMHYYVALWKTAVFPLCDAFMYICFGWCCSVTNILANNVPQWLKKMQYSAAVYVRRPLHISEASCWSQCEPWLCLPLWLRLFTSLLIFSCRLLPSCPTPFPLSYSENLFQPRI